MRKQITVWMLMLALLGSTAVAKPAEQKHSKSFTGELRQVVSDDFETGEAITQTLLRLDNGKELRLQGDNFDGLAGERVTVTGTRTDALNFSVDLVQQSGAPKQLLSSLTSGTQNALVVMTKYAASPTPSYGQTEVASIIDSAAAFWAEDSYNKFALSPSYEGWTSLSGAPGSLGTLGSLYPAVVAAVDPAVDFQNVDMLIIIGDLHFPPNAKGQAFVTPTDVTSADGTKEMRIFAADIDEVISSQLRAEFIVKHELGHTVGLGHAFQYDCVDEPLKDPLSNCTLTTDIYNVMREISVGLPVHHLHAQQKLHATHLDASQVNTVTETGIYSIVPLALPPGPGDRAIRLAEPADTPLWIEYRQPIGMDIGMDDAPTGQTSSVFDGAMITRPISSNQMSSALIDADFSQGTPLDYLHYTLRPGETLEDPFSNSSITTISATPSALTVAIEIDCQDADGDGYGVNCLAGDDCNDNDPNITTSGPAEVDVPVGEYLEFGDVLMSQVLYKTIEIVNDGCETLAILGVNSPDADFELLNPTLFFPIPAKSSAFLVVRFTPSALGPDRSDILIQTSDTDEQWITVSAIANVVTPQEIDYSPGSFSVTLPTGGQSTEVLTIDNLGGNALNYMILNQASVSWLDIDADDALASIPGFGQKQVELDFNADGQCSATGSVSLRMLSNDADENEVFIPVTWSVFAAPDVDFSWDPTDPAPILFNSPGTVKSVQITNDGCLPLTINSIASSVPATYSAPFSGPITVAPGASYSQNVTFNGCPPRGGIANCGASLTIQTDDPDEATTNFLFFGSGFAP